MKDIDKIGPNFPRNVAIAAALIAGLLFFLAIVQGVDDATERAIQTAAAARTTQK